MINGKIIALTTQTFINKVMSLLFNMLSKFVIASVTRSLYIGMNLRSSFIHNSFFLSGSRTEPFSFFKDGLILDKRCTYIIICETDHQSRFDT